MADGPETRSQAGQAQLELIAGLPLLALAALIALQLLGVGYAQSLADGAAEAGALAAADGRRAEGGARAGLPGWADGRVDVQVADGEVEVRLRPPVVVPGLSGDQLEVTSRAYARPGDD